jgi:hypothetical protein
VGKEVPLGMPRRKAGCEHCVWTSNNWKDIRIVERVQMAGEKTLSKERALFWNQTPERWPGSAALSRSTSFMPPALPEVTDFNKESE